MQTISDAFTSYCVRVITHLYTYQLTVINGDSWTRELFIDKIRHLVLSVTHSNLG